MSSNHDSSILEMLKHYLPTQAPLKDFIHHNTLHAFQHNSFHQGLFYAAQWFDYKTYLSLDDYRKAYANNEIEPSIVRHQLDKNSLDASEWLEKLLHKDYDEEIKPKIGLYRKNWSEKHQLNLDKEVHPVLFKIIGAFLDQGVSIWNLPTTHKSFIESIQYVELYSASSFFKTKEVRDAFIHLRYNLDELLEKISGSKESHAYYLLDQQFAHPGWSGMVSVLEDQPQTLVDKRKISLEEFILLELYLEWDILVYKLGNHFKPLSYALPDFDFHFFSQNFEDKEELFTVYKIWQESFEWTYYDQVLSALLYAEQIPSTHSGKSFQAILCIDDRECSFRRYLEQLDPNCKTFGTPGFFGVDAFFQSENSKFATKICPAPVQPKHIILEQQTKSSHKKDFHLTKSTHSLLGGWLTAFSLGYWSIIQLAINLFRPKSNALVVSSFRHMDPEAQLTVEHQHNDEVHGCQVGYTLNEMTNRVENLLKSIGLVDQFAPYIYVVGHGASSVNNTHYAGYDCGACSGRPGSVNARAFCIMANHPKVRLALKNKGLDIPESTRFIAALHETTQDEIAFYDLQLLSEEQKKRHKEIEMIFHSALSLNAKERSRRFILTDSHGTADQVHENVKLRAVSLFEPRPELNHATNALCIIGRREITDHLFLDRRAFMNSYHYQVDPEGKYLQGILNAAAPVCGGINLEYYFSRVDPYKLGAGTKLPHNVMGLIGVANGMEGDLRTGLPTQMVEVHDPLRLLMIVEHKASVLLHVIQSNPATYEWFLNEWIHLIVLDPEEHQLYQFQSGKFEPYMPQLSACKLNTDLNQLIETKESNFPVYILNTPS